MQVKKRKKYNNKYSEQMHEGTGVTRYLHKNRKH